MGNRDGHVELDRAIDSIRVGRRHRRDLGDLDALIDSIRRLGMLQPITISPDGTLVCGARRLEAARRLGMRRVNVWVRAGISDRLHQLLAEQHDNTVRKPFSPTEAAALYAELKTLMAEDATRRQRASRFGATPEPGQPVPGDGAAESTAPSQRTSRARAARMVTGRDSHSMLDQVLELQHLAEAPDTPEDVRDAAAAALAAIDAGDKVNGHYRAVMAVRGQPAGPPPGPGTSQTGPPDGDQLARRRFQRRFLLDLDDLESWPDRHRPADVATHLDQSQWDRFTTAITTITGFHATASRARAERPGGDAAAAS